MLHRVTPLLGLPLMAVSIAISAPAMAETSFDNAGANGPAGRELPAYLQCVPYAREQSGIKIYGDAHTWWGQAEGRFDRGSSPKIGAVMAFQPHRNMRLGHVAAVSRIIDGRTVLLRHSNWSPINGRRGQIEKDVRAVDVSPNNDWSQVRVWYHPSQALGKTAWPIHGFIYPDKAPNFSQPSQMARATVSAAPAAPVSREPSRAFMNAFAALEANSAQRSSRPPALTASPQRNVRVVQSQRRRQSEDRVAVALSLYD